jgi:uncharacterized protein YndB with AHSA1/START domain
MPSGGRSFDYTLAIASRPARVIEAFFDPFALERWWQATRSITTPRPLGVYAIEWDPTPFRDDILGPLGGVFHGTVMDAQAGRGFFVADAYWLPPEGDPIGPMALQVSCETEHAGRTRLRVVQSGYEESARWRRYYDVIAQGWVASLASLRDFLEASADERRAWDAAGRSRREPE